jgi:zinc protease
MVDSKRFHHGEDEEFRKYPPDPDADVLFVPPDIQEVRLTNGLRILLAERHDMPIVATQIVVNRGYDLQPSPRIAAMTASMLLAGTHSRSALASSEAFEALGARYGSWADYDGMGVSGQCLSNQIPLLFAQFSDIIRNPSFDVQELERERTRRLSSLAAQFDDPDALLDNALAERLYPMGHPFHSALKTVEKTIRNVKAADLANFHQLAYRPAHATVTMAGDIDREQALALVEKNLGDWTGEAVPRIAFPGVPAMARGEKRILLIDRPDDAQSNIMLAIIGMARKNPDYDAAMVLNTLLGGQFSSRLNLNLREKHAITYGAYSVLEARRDPGPWCAGAAVTTSATALAIREIFSEIERLRSEFVPATELQNAKTSLIRKLPARFETAAGTAQALSSLSILDLPLDVFATRQTRVARVTPEDVHRVANLYLRPEAMRIFIVGDARAIREDLEKLDLGEIEVRPATMAALDVAK